MPKERFKREAILSAAADIVRERGEEALTVRALAERMGSSTQPVYSQFKSMALLRSALLEEAKRQYHARIVACMDTAHSRYEAYGKGFVRFAAEEKGLFRLLFLERKDGDPFLEEIIKEMREQYHMDEERARAFHVDMTVFSYGLAILVYLGGRSDSEEEISAALCREFYALYRYYFPERSFKGENNG